MERQWTYLRRVGCRRRRQRRLSRRRRRLRLNVANEALSITKVGVRITSTTPNHLVSVPCRPYNRPLIGAKSYKFGHLQMQQCLMTCNLMTTLP